MAARDEWYRSSKWDATARQEFDANIAKAGAGYDRAQYFWLKAGALFYARPVRFGLRLAAIELLKRALVESDATGRDRGKLLDDLGRYQLLIGDRDEAIASLREALSLGTGSQQFPRTEVVLARCLADAGDRAGAIALYDAAYPPDAKIGGKPSYETLAKREFLDAKRKPYRDPEDAAEAIITYFRSIAGGVPEILASNFTSLAALDSFFRIERDLERPHAPFQYKRDFLEEHFVAELGAYVGLVLSREGDGTWRRAPRLMQSRVVIGKRELDPFRVGYATAYYELPVEAEARALLQGAVVA